MSKAARLAGVDRTTLYRLMERHGLQRETVTVHARVTPVRRVPASGGSPARPAATRRPDPALAAAAAASAAGPSAPARPPAARPPRACPPRWRRCGTPGRTSAATRSTRPRRRGCSTWLVAAAARGARGEALERGGLAASTLGRHLLELAAGRGPATPGGRPTRRRSPRDAPALLDALERVREAIDPDWSGVLQFAALRAGRPRPRDRRGARHPLAAHVDPLPRRHARPRAERRPQRPPEAPAPPDLQRGARPQQPRQRRHRAGARRRPARGTGAGAVLPRRGARVRCTRWCSRSRRRRGWRSATRPAVGAPPRAGRWP